MAMLLGAARLLKEAEVAGALEAGMVRGTFMCVSAKRLGGHSSLKGGTKAEM